MKGKIKKVLSLIPIAYAAPQDPRADMPYPDEYYGDGGSEYGWVVWIVILGIIFIPVIYQTIKEKMGHKK